MMNDGWWMIYDGWWNVRKGGGWGGDIVLLKLQKQWLWPNSWAAKEEIKTKKNAKGGGQGRKEERKKRKKEKDADPLLKWPKVR
jgi:hypothetical protein